MKYLGTERRAVSVDALAEQVACTVRAFHTFRKDEFIPLRNDVGKLSEVLDTVKFLKTGFQVTSWITGTAAAGALFGKTMGWW